MGNAPEDTSSLVSYPTSSVKDFFPRTSSGCWRLCRGRGTLVHILWGCPKIKPLWLQVESLIADISPFNQPLQPSMAILYLDLGSVPTPYITVILHILMATCLSILRHWKNIAAPTFSEVINTVHTHSTYEILYASVMRKFENISRLWAPWQHWRSGRMDC